MSTGMHDDDDDVFPPRQLLDTWTVTTPPAGFADRVMTARQARPRTHVKAVLFPLMSAAAAAVLVLTAQYRPMSAATGRWHNDIAEEVALGERATAAAAGGAQFSWNVQRGGNTDVTQSHGSIFYRVEKGGPFVVNTPGGTVTVQGTSFSVDILDGDKAMNSNGVLGKSTVMGAVGGAMLTAAVLVTVYEGRVALASGGGNATLTAGQSAVGSASEAPHRVNGRLSALEAESRRVASERDSLRGQVEEMEAQIRDMTLSKQEGKNPLETEVTALRQQLKNARESLAAERSEAAARAGETVPWPKDLAPAYKQDGLQRAFTDAIKAAGLDGEITSIDCTEFPCLVYGKAKHADKPTQEADIKKFEAALQQTYPQEGHSMHESIWSHSNKTDDGKTDLQSTFGIAIYPKDAVDESSAKQVGKRVRYRRQQYDDAENPN